jgi:hypothetical protein
MTVTAEKPEPEPKNRRSATAQAVAIVAAEIIESAGEDRIASAQSPPVESAALNLFDEPQTRSDPTG